MFSKDNSNIDSYIDKNVIEDIDDMADSIRNNIKDVSLMLENASSDSYKYTYNTIQPIVTNISQGQRWQINDLANDIDYYLDNINIVTNFETGRADHPIFKNPFSTKHFTLYMVIAQEGVGQSILDNENVNIDTDNIIGEGTFGKVYNLFDKDQAQEQPYKDKRISTVRKTKAGRRKTPR